MRRRFLCARPALVDSLVSRLYDRVLVYGCEPLDAGKIHEYAVEDTSPRSPERDTPPAPRQSEFGDPGLRQRLEVSRVDLFRVSFVVGHLVDGRDGGTPSSQVLVRPLIVRPRDGHDIDLCPFGDLARVAQ
jgi:hypothetical protein